MLASRSCQTMNLTSQSEIKHDKDAPVYKCQSDSTRKRTLKHQNNVLKLNKNYKGILLKVLLKNTVLTNNISFPPHCQCSIGKYRSVP